MKIAVIGCGYVGLVTGACLSNLGNDVVSVDINPEKVEKLKKGIIPIFEPGLKELVELNSMQGRLKFTTGIEDPVRESDVIFIAVGTPSDPASGKADLSYVFGAARDIGVSMNSYKVIVVKSTVPPGTCLKVRDIILSSLKSKVAFDVVSNPEFLREGEAIHDFMIPDRIVVGVDSEAARKIMLNIYKPIERTGRPILFTDITSSELIKYASNAMLANRISFMNELSRLCEVVGADIKLVSHGVGLDSRIGSRFLQAGAGYGGSCFPKDVRALIGFMKEAGLKTEMLEAVDRVNESQKLYVVEKVMKILGSMKGKRICVWGLSFKPKTDDMRDAPSIVLINELQNMGAVISAFDPVAAINSRKILKDVEYASNPYDAVKDADCLVVITEWDDFRELDKARVKSLMKSHNVVDARNIYEPGEMKAFGFNYVSIGR